MDSQQQKNKERVLQWEEKLKISGMCQKFGMTRKMAEERLTKIFVAIWWAAMFGVSIGDQGGIKGAAGALCSDDGPVTNNLNSLLS